MAHRPYAAGEIGCYLGWKRKTPTLLCAEFPFLPEQQTMETMIP
jgi:hypothetical protein